MSNEDGGPGPGRQGPEEQPPAFPPTKVEGAQDPAASGERRFTQIPPPYPAAQSAPTAGPEQAGHIATPFEAQTGPGQPYPSQPYPGQAYPGQAYPGQAYPGQAYPGQTGVTQPVGAGWSATPAGGGKTRRRPSWLTISLAVVNVLALLGGAAGFALTGWMITDRERKVSVLETQRADQLKRLDGEKAKLQSDMEAADLDGKMAEVAAKNVAYREALHSWVTRGKKQSELHLWLEARSACLAAIVAYDYYAAKYIEILPLTLPEHVDMVDGDYNCLAKSFGTA